MWTIEEHRKEQKARATWGTLLSANFVSQGRKDGNEKGRGEKKVIWGVTVRWRLGESSDTNGKKIVNDQEVTLRLGIKLHDGWRMQ